MIDRNLFPGQHMCVLTTNRALAELAAEIHNSNHFLHDHAFVEAAQGSWALRKKSINQSYAIVDWTTLRIVGWEHLGHLGHTRLSGPWMGGA